MSPGDIFVGTSFGHAGFPHFFVVKKVATIETTNPSGEGLEGSIARA